MHVGRILVSKCKGEGVGMMMRRRRRSLEMSLGPFVSREGREREREGGAETSTKLSYQGLMRSRGV